MRFTALAGFAVFAAMAALVFTLGTLASAPTVALGSPLPTPPSLA